MKAKAAATKAASGAATPTANPYYQVPPAVVKGPSSAVAPWSNLGAGTQSAVGSSATTAQGANSSVVSVNPDNDRRMFFNSLASNIDPVSGLPVDYVDINGKVVDPTVPGSRS